MKCLICSKELLCISNTHLKKHNLTCEEYKKIFNLGKVEKEIKGIEKIDFVICKLCNKKFMNLSSHLRIHHIKSKEYKEKFPGCSIKSKNLKNKISDSLKGRVSYWKGRKRSLESNEKTRKKLLGRISPMRGRKHSIAARKKTSLALKGRTFTKETKEKMSQSRVNYIKKHKFEVKIFNTEPELYLKRQFENRNISFEYQYVIENKIYDFLLLDFNLLIEVDGRYWHCNMKKKPCNYKKIIINDEYKNKLAKDNGYRLIRIWEDEIDKVWRIIV